jgi:hypothetical protein
VALAIGLAAAACNRPAPAVAPVAATLPCTATQGELAAGARAAALAGEYRLSLVATSGARAGSTAAGALRLRGFGAARPPVPAAAGASFPLFGGTTVPLAEVGAIAPGDVARDDAAAPGVLAIESEQGGRRDILLRLGVDANQNTPPRFDGSRMVLFVTSVAPTRFAGRWESGGGNVRSGGHFCADRV